MDRKILVLPVVVLIVLAIILILSQDKQTNTQTPLETQNTSQVADGNDEQKNTVTYNHPEGSGTEEKDCFDDVCLTRGAGGPILGDAEWACSKCFEASDWFPSFDKPFIKSCVVGHTSNIVGTDLCVRTGEAMWDLVFSSYQGGSTGGGFSYTRTLYE
jgi:hypothetical protein